MVKTEPGSKSVTLSKPRRRSIGAVRSPEAHKAILDAARAILDERGYAGFTIEAVARRAGASKPTIYRWWKGKADLIMEVYENERELALTVPDYGSLERELMIRMHNLWRLWQSTPLAHALRSIIAEAQIDPVALALLRDEFLPKRQAWTRMLFARAVARGELSGKADIEAAINLIYGFNLFRLLTHQLEDKSMIDRCMRIIVAGLKQQAGHARDYLPEKRAPLGKRKNDRRPRKLTQ